ncbi:MAG: YdcF family protein [Oscillospiraceae bacterium]|nr:YdcF family protein [Oscillospiraceae bacterium]
MSDTSKSPRSSKHKRVQAALSFITAAAALIAGELVAARWSGAWFIALTTRLLSFALLFYGALCVLLLKHRLPRLARFLRAVWLTAAALALLSFTVVEILIFTGDKSDFEGEPPGDYMIILGAGLKGSTPSATLASRLDAALPYLLNASDDMLCVLSGGQGKDEDISEAFAMYRYLTARGVPPARLMLETRSTNTAQNIAYSLEILDNRARSRGLAGIEGQNVMVCSSGYHLFRARCLLKRGGAAPYALNAPPPRLHLKISGYLREYFSVMFMWRTAG